MDDNTHIILGTVLFVLGLIVGGIEIAYMNGRGQRGKTDNVASVMLALVAFLLLTTGFGMWIKAIRP